jgi:hypothetical protein
LQGLLEWMSPKSRLRHASMNLPLKSGALVANSAWVWGNQFATDLQREVATLARAAERPVRPRAGAARLGRRSPSGTPRLWRARCRLSRPWRAEGALRRPRRYDSERCNRHSVWGLSRCQFFDSICRCLLVHATAGISVCAVMRGWLWRVCQAARRVGKQYPCDRLPE